MAEDLAAPRMGWAPGPWRACKNGDCSCGHVWSIPVDAPIAKATIGDWGDEVAVIGADGPKIDMMVYGSIPEAMGKANARLIAAAPELYEVLNYVADMTYCGRDAEWHFKPGYDPQVVLDALAKAQGEG